MVIASIKDMIRLPLMDSDGGSLAAVPGDVLYGYAFIPGLSWGKNVMVTQ
mgnify:CR=1|tara:strand:- start:12585 stop:12734 length:150 start_codon:yes stop_codon:yes gene_type:complete